MQTQLKIGMCLSNGKITSEGTVTGKTGTTNISVIFTLEKQAANGNYTYVDSWTASSSSMLLSSRHSTANCTAGTYSLSVSGTVTKDGYAEPISDWLIKTL